MVHHVLSVLVSPAQLIDRLVAYWHLNMGMWFSWGFADFRDFNEFQMGKKIVGWHLESAVSCSEVFSLYVAQSIIAVSLISELKSGGLNVRIQSSTKIWSYSSIRYAFGLGVWILLVALASVLRRTLVMIGHNSHASCHPSELLVVCISNSQWIVRKLDQVQ